MDSLVIGDDLDKNISSKESNLDASIVTVATHDSGLYNELIDNKFGVKIKTLGFGEKWTGFRMKSEKVLEYIKDLDDNHIVIFVDGFDSVVNGTLEDAIEEFVMMDCRILISKAYVHDQWIRQVTHRRVFNYKKGDYSANSGLYMGYVKELKIFLKDILDLKCGDDQINFNVIAKKYDFVKMDTQNTIFENIQKNIGEDNKHKELTPLNGIFVSYPGTPSTERILRATKEYGQFFLKEALLVVLITFWWLMHMKMDKIALGVLITFIILYFYIDKSCVV